MQRELFFAPIPNKIRSMDLELFLCWRRRTETVTNVAGIVLRLNEARWMVRKRGVSKEFGPSDASKIIL